MTRYLITVLHNNNPDRRAQNQGFQNGDELTDVFDFHYISAAANRHPTRAADWLAEILTCELEDLQDYRGDDECGEERFFAACTYRLMHLRSLAIGDVLHVVDPVRDDSGGVWLAVELSGWRAIERPDKIARQGRLGDRVLNHMHAWASEGAHA